jgi:NADPH2:quinone reductase
MILTTGKRINLPRYAASQEDAVENVLELVDMQAPDPASLKPNEVIVAVKSCAVSFVDLLMLSGQYQHMLPLPCTPGLEYAGVITAVGSAVDAEKLKVGDAVLSDFILTGPRSKGAYRGNGGWASFAVAPDYGVHRIPAGLSFDQACNFRGNYETAYYALVNRGNIQPGETVLINGASGATGMAAVQMAKILGAQVIATGRSQAKLELVKASGADHVIDTSDADDPGAVRRFRDEVKQLTNGNGADMVYDTVGGALSVECLRSLRFAGRHVIVGWAGNTTVAKGHGERGSDNADRLPTNIIQMKGLYVMGSPMVIHTERDMSIRAERLARIDAWAAEGRIKPHVSSAWPLENFRDGMRARLKGLVTGGCVLNP